MKHIIVFDGVCNLCNWGVRFIIRRDRKAKFKFTSLQSNYANQLLNKSGAKFQRPEFIIYIRRNTILTKSTAVLMILRDLGSLWNLFYFLILVPKVLRDFIYDLVAKNRYKLFGKKEFCMVPSPEIKGRFLEE